MTAPTGTGRVYGGRSAEHRDADRRARLMEAGLEAFGTEGYQATTITQLCAAAGVATRSFYEMFASREALLIALHDEINARALDAVVAAVATADTKDLHGRATAAFSAYLDVITTDPRWVRITLRETVGASPETFRARHAAIARFTSFLNDELDRLAALDVIPQRDHRLTAVGIVGGVTALVESLVPLDAPPAKLRRAEVDRVREEGVRLILAAAFVTHAP